MAANTRYQRLPDDGRPSTDSVAGDNVRLLGRLGNDPTPPKKPLEFSYHPTFYTRLLVLALHVPALVLYILSKHSADITTIVFVCLAITRNLLVLYQDTIGRFIRVRIEVVGAISTPSGQRQSPPRWLTQRFVQIFIDLFLIATLLATSIVAHKHNNQYWRYHHRFTLAACILCWISLPFQVVSAVDMGKPSRTTVTNIVSFNTDDEKTAHAQEPQISHDVEASGALHSRKSGADSPLYT